MRNMNEREETESGTQAMFHGFPPSSGDAHSLNAENIESQECNVKAGLISTVTNMPMSKCRWRPTLSQDAWICLYARVVDSVVAFVAIERARIADVCRIFLHLGCANILPMRHHPIPIEKYDMNQKRNSPS
jgi:hypothetical protein